MEAAAADHEGLVTSVIHRQVIRLSSTTFPENPNTELLRLILDSTCTFRQPEKHNRHMV